jgi:hypothetical protein
MRRCGKPLQASHLGDDGEAWADVRSRWEGRGLYGTAKLSRRLSFPTCILCLLNQPHQTCSLAVGRYHDVRAHLKLLEGFKRQRGIETRETAAAVLKQSKVQLKTEKEITKRNKSEKLALLEALSHHGLVRYDDLQGVFDE